VLTNEVRNTTQRGAVWEQPQSAGIIHQSPKLSDLPAATLATTRVGYLPQRFDLLDEQASALDNVLATAQTATPAAVRAGLARLLIRGDAVFRPVADLSGGERFRVGLARLLLAEPAPQLLVLDEPTNNLDMTSVDQLIQALSRYRGAILVVSHDAEFRRRLGVTVTLELVSCTGNPSHNSRPGTTLDVVVSHAR